MIEASYHPYLQHLIQGNRRACRKVVEELLDRNVDIKALYLDLFQRSLYDIGDLWAQNRISVAVEHMATAITESLFPLVYPRLFMAEHNGRKAVISCVANEFHQIGGKMVADIMELNGWDAYFLGADSPLPDLLAFLDAKEPDMAGLSLSLGDNLPRLIEAVEAIRANHPSLPLIVGGQAFRDGGASMLESYPGVTLIRSLPELERHIRAFDHAA